jgi:hypothetical protein
MSEIHNRIMVGTFFASKFLRYKFFQFLPIAANREIEKFASDWDKLLVRCSNESDRVCLSVLALLPI